MIQSDDGDAVRWPGDTSAAKPLKQMDNCAVRSEGTVRSWDGIVRIQWAGVALKRSVEPPNVAISRGFLEVIP